MKSTVYIGLDIGSVSVNMALLLENGDSRAAELTGTKEFFKIPSKLKGSGTLLLSAYLRHQGDPFRATERLFKSVFKIIPEKQCRIMITGSGARAAAAKWKAGTINIFRAIAKGMAALYPDVSTVFELGGERSRFLRLEPGSGRILDYEMNGECAAGTGAFFDQQAGRLRIPVEETGKAVLNCERCAVIAGRCSVFAKSDMIHAQQRGFTPPEVLKGLSVAVVRNFKGSITKGKTLTPKVALIGGVAANEGVAEAFRDVFTFSDGEFFIPAEYAWMGAVGAVLSAAAGNDEAFRQAHSAGKARKSHPTERPLSMRKVRLLRDIVRPYTFPKEKVNAYLGIDIGSVSTNLALIDEKGDLIHGIYRMTEGRPVEVVKKALLEMQACIPGKVCIRGVGTTGSGRELIGIFAGADVIKDEITAHKTGADHIAGRFLNKRVDTIFEVGGQDSKFISIEGGTVVDFALNEACAAGTGSFLEEQAGQMDIAIREEFSKLALSARNPLKLGERCTVFMEKEVVPYMQAGIPKADIAAGLAYGVVLNYLNKVVKKRKIGNTIFFQGGTAYNDSVAAAFSTILDKEIIVPPHNGIMGAIGAALLARKKGVVESTFRGWDLNRVKSSLREFTCQGCDNACLIQEFTVEGEKSYWGDRCSDRYRKRSKSSRKPTVPDLTRLQEKALFAGYTARKGGRSRTSVGIPRALHFYHRFPFWRVYFETLGFDVIISGPSHQRMIEEGIEATVAEPCFPVQAAHGHILDLIAKKADLLFIPNLVTEEDATGSINSYICPWTQTLPLVVRHTPAFTGHIDRILYPNIQFRLGRDFVEARLRSAMKGIGVKPAENRAAVKAAYEAQAIFEQQIEKAGKSVIPEMMDRKNDAVVLLGRPYNLYDPGLNLNVPAKLRDLYGMNVIPMDFLPLHTVNIHEVHTHMFWNFGRKILQAARFVREHSHLHLIYLSNFKCGPDSYIRHYVQEAAGKPFLFLQLDSHANDAGIMTRIEAFLESKKLL